MEERWVGLVVSGDRVVVVDTEVPASGPIVLQSDQTWRLQKGEREEAYHVLYQQCSDYLRENGIAKAVLKASAVTMGSMKKAHLESAEVRGVVTAAARSVCTVKTVAKSLISRTFGERKVDEYVRDQEFWGEQVIGANLRVGSREAAMLILAARNAG